MDIGWLEDKLMLSSSDVEAASHLKAQIRLALKSKSTQLNDAAHVLRHHT